MQATMSSYSNLRIRPTEKIMPAPPCAPPPMVQSGSDGGQASVRLQKGQAGRGMKKGSLAAVVALAVPFCSALVVLTAEVLKPQGRQRKASRRGWLESYHRLSLNANGRLWSNCATSFRTPGMKKTVSSSPYNIHL
ncbi:hypothetical protein Vretifemale_6754 [Volvox reticuliferus]|uniref:Uncharacterized protein n=1 Tax=Volvox reticuliferus TaxID=1737510 RepID=A0A8J4CES1_9CHLO|nr:hypothetical protein Vretifemale_6754 [Volvox reticuliferus]